LHANETPDPRDLPDPETEADRRRAAQDEILIAALAAGESYSAAAKIAGITSRTVARRMADPAFASEVSRRRGQIVAELTGKLTTLGADAVEVLRDCLHAEKPSDQIRAAHLILSLLAKFRSDSEHEARLTELERLAGLSPDDDMEDER
jgi:hypothetical protein